MDKRLIQNGIQPATDQLSADKAPTRKQKKAINAAKHAAVQAAALAAARIQAGEAPTAEQLQQADPAALAAEIRKIAPTLSADDRQRQLAKLSAASRALLVPAQQAMARGRPEEYTQEEAQAICMWIQEGKSLRSYCRATGRSASGIYGWMFSHPDFAARYARAHEDKADTIVDEMLAIADELAEPGANPTIEDVAVAKLRLDARKWIAEKLRPGKYGQKLEIERKDSVHFHIGIPNRVVDITPEQPPAIPHKDKPE